MAKGVARRKEARLSHRLSLRPGASDPPSALALRARRAVVAGDVDAAMRLYGEAVSRGCASPDVFNDLGALLARRGQLPAAVVQLEIALALAPGHPDARGNLLKALEAMAVAAFQEGRLADAAAGFTRLAALEPDCVVFQSNAGSALRELRLPEQALPYLRRARALDPDNAKVCFRLGLVLFDLDQRACEAELARAIELDPGYVEAHVNLALVASRLGQLDRAAAILGRALALAPDHVEAHANLASLLREQGEIEASGTHYRRALELCPGSSSILSNSLLARQSDPAVEPAELLADHAVWAARFAAPVDPGPTPGFPTLDRDRDPERRLRLGYLSPDLRSHSVASFLEPLIAAHDRRHVEVFCYSDAVPDAVTARIQAAADGWCDSRRLTDAALAARVADDRIDVLVDLAGHTAGNRLLCFARRPAPVQVSYCGYPGTTGLPAIGWRLTDALADPEGLSDGHTTERLWRLPNGFLCFRPDPGAAAVGPLPAEAAGFVTFGSFNNLAKLGPEVLDLWAEILRAVPDSRLLLKARALSDQTPRERLRRRFSEHGIDPRRIRIEAYAATPSAHLALYGEVDVALDPFPYNGTTTTCEALWMGVPVVTLRGRSHAGRVGASLLTRVGLGELVADTREAYVGHAVRIAGDRAALAATRATLRARVAASPLTSPEIIARDIEAAFRGMWKLWCAGAAAVATPAS